QVRYLLHLPSFSTLANSGEALKFFLSETAGPRLPMAGLLLNTVRFDPSALLPTTRTLARIASRVLCQASRPNRDRQPASPDARSCPKPKQNGSVIATNHSR